MVNNILFNPIDPHDLALLPPKFDYKDSRLTELLIKARVELAELKGYSSSMPNQKLLLSPALLKESIASSGIENIHTTIMNVLENQLFPEQEQAMADKEVLRYKDAVNEGLKSLKQFELSTRTIQTIHANLLTNYPGIYRENEGIVIADASTKQIIYTPPSVGKIPDFMGNLENFMHIEEDMDPLIKAAVIHYQFESIHPFNDGNGRAGRILMVLWLVKSGLLTFPTLYISGYLLKNRPDYYRVLLGVTKEQKWKEYIEFMLQGFYLQAKETKELLFKITLEYKALKTELKSNHRNMYNSVDLVDSLFAFPVITASRLAERVNCTWETASNYLKTLKKAGILEDRKVGKYHFYMNKKLLSILYN